MCGLAGYVTRGKGVPPHAQDALTNALLLAIEHRGTDATGIVAVTEQDAALLLKAPIRAADFTRTRPPLPAGTRAVLGHTRYATQGSPQWGFNNHPVRVGDTYLTHNGHVHNQAEIETAAGLRPMASVDSACLAALVETAPGGPVGALDLFSQVEGAAAVAYWNPTRAPGTVVLARINGSPLYVWEGRSAVVWASTDAAIRDAWAVAHGAQSDPKRMNVRMMREGEAAIVGPAGKVEWRSFAPGRDPWHHYNGPGSPGFRPFQAPTPKAKAKAKAAPTGAATAPHTAPASAALPRGRVSAAPPQAPSQDWSLFDGPADGLTQCDNCRDWYPDGRTVTIDIGGEPFQMCAQCASWSDSLFS